MRRTNVLSVMPVALAVLAAATIFTIVVLDRTSEGAEPLTPTTTLANEPRSLSVFLLDRVIERFDELDDGTVATHGYAWMAEVVAIRHGWDDARVDEYLGRVVDARNPDGGFGLGQAWDAFSDGTVNPADTTYAITVTDHVGRVAIAAHEAGVVEAPFVQELVDLIEAFPRASDDAGECIAYSSSGFDEFACVDNINASAAYFLHRAQESGFALSAPGLIDRLVARERVTPIDGAWWPYSALKPGTRQDWYHNATNVEAALELDPELGAVTLAEMKATEPEATEDLNALMRLASYDCSLLNDDAVTASAEAVLENWDDPRELAILAHGVAIAEQSCASIASE